MIFACRCNRSHLHGKHSMRHRYNLLLGDKSVKVSKSIVRDPLMTPCSTLKFNLQCIIMKSKVTSLQDIAVVMTNNSAMR